MILKRENDVNPRKSMLDTVDKPKCGIVQIYQNCKMKLNT